MTVDPTAVDPTAVDPTTVDPTAVDPTAVPPMATLRHSRPLSRRERAQRSRAGFTLLELMVALVAGLIAISSIYYISAASSKHFHEQQRVAQTQMAVRMAMERLRRDVARAGFLGTPNSQKEVSCRSAAGGVQLRAVEYLPNADVGALPNAAENGVTADGIRLTGNYVTSDAYLAQGLGVGGRTVTFQTDWQAFRHTFGIVGSTYDGAAFDDVFRAGRFLHIETQQGQHFFVQITGTNASNQTVTFTPNLPVGSTCIPGLGDGALVSPISRIEYRVVDPRTAGGLANLLSPNATGGTDPGLADARGLKPAVLIRREVDFTNAATPIAGSEQVVLEFAANLEYSFVFDSQSVRGQPPTLVTQTKGIAATTLNVTPERVRSVLISLSGRTPDQEPTFHWAARAANAPLTRYRANPASSGASRVRTLTTEVLIPNVASRVLR